MVKQNLRLTNGSSLLFHVDLKFAYRSTSTFRALLLTSVQTPVSLYQYFACDAYLGRPWKLSSRALTKFFTGNAESISCSAKVFTGNRNAILQETIKKIIHKSASISEILTPHTRDGTQRRMSEGFCKTQTRRIILCITNFDT